MNKPKQQPARYAPADAGQITRDYLDSILIEERLVGAEVPDLGMDLWGEHFDTPVTTPAFPADGHGASEHRRHGRPGDALPAAGE